jgi:hypothetical protein
MRDLLGHAHGVLPLLTFARRLMGVVGILRM